jgi:heme-degrading monooxygenase HmoA
MPVLEILLLKTKPSIPPTSPLILTSLQTVRSLLAAKIHATQSHFYRTTEDASKIYILGLWPSLSAHQAFLASPLRKEILAPQEELLDFVWCVHVQVSGWEDVPIGAPVVSIARIKVKGGEEGRHESVTGKYEGRLREATGWGVVSGWVLDEGGERENVVITGWRTREEHLEFGRGMGEEFEDYRALREGWESVDVGHGKDMEQEG